MARKMRSMTRFMRKESIRWGKGGGSTPRRAGVHVARREKQKPLLHNMIIDPHKTRGAVNKANSNRA